MILLSGHIDTSKARKVSLTHLRSSLLLVQVEILQKQLNTKQTKVHKEQTLVPIVLILGLHDFRGFFSRLVGTKKSRLVDY